MKREVAELQQEKAALKREVAELKQDNEDLNADGETLLEWGNKLRRMGRMIEKDFKNLFQDIKEKKGLFEPGTDHTDNCDKCTCFKLQFVYKDCKFTSNCYGQWACVHRKHEVNRSSPRVHVA